MFYHLPSGVKQTVGNYCVNMPVNTGGVGLSRAKYPQNYTFVFDLGLCRLCIRGYRDALSYASSARHQEFEDRISRLEI